MVGCSEISFSVKVVSVLFVFYMFSEGKRRRECVSDFAEVFYLFG